MNNQSSIKQNANPTAATHNNPQTSQIIAQRETALTEQITQSGRIEGTLQVDNTKPTGTYPDFDRNRSASVGGDVPQASMAPKGNESNDFINSITNNLPEVLNKVLPLTHKEELEIFNCLIEKILPSAFNKITAGNQSWCGATKSNNTLAISTFLLHQKDSAIKDKNIAQILSALNIHNNIVTHANINADLSFWHDNQHKIITDISNSIITPEENTKPTGAAVGGNTKPTGTTVGGNRAPTSVEVDNGAPTGQLIQSGRIDGTLQVDNIVPTEQAVKSRLIRSNIETNNLPIIQNDTILHKNNTENPQLTYFEKTIKYPDISSKRAKKELNAYNLSFLFLNELFRKYNKSIFEPLYSNPAIVAQFIDIFTSSKTNTIIKSAPPNGSNNQNLNDYIEFDEEKALIISHILNRQHNHWLFELANDLQNKCHISLSLNSHEIQFCKTFDFSADERLIKEVSLFDLWHLQWFNNRRKKHSVKKGARLLSEAHYQFKTHHAQAFKLQNTLGTSEQKNTDNFFIAKAPQHIAEDSNNEEKSSDTPEIYHFTVFAPKIENKRKMFNLFITDFFSINPILFKKLCAQNYIQLIKQLETAFTSPSIENKKPSIGANETITIEPQAINKDKDNVHQPQEVINNFKSIFAQKDIATFWLHSLYTKDGWFSTMQDDEQQKTIADLKPFLSKNTLAYYKNKSNLQNILNVVHPIQNALKTTEKHIHPKRISGDVEVDNGAPTGQLIQSARIDDQGHQFDRIGDGFPVGAVDNVNTISGTPDFMKQISKIKSEALKKSLKTLWGIGYYKNLSDLTNLSYGFSKIKCQIYSNATKIIEQSASLLKENLTQSNIETKSPSSMNNNPTVIKISQKCPPKAHSSGDEAPGSTPETQNICYNLFDEFTSINYISEVETLPITLDAGITFTFLDAIGAPFAKKALFECFGDKWISHYEIAKTLLSSLNNAQHWLIICKLIDTNPNNNGFSFSSTFFENSDNAGQRWKLNNEHQQWLLNWCYPKINASIENLDTIFTSNTNPKSNNPNDTDDKHKFWLAIKDHWFDNHSNRELITNSVELDNLTINPHGLNNLSSRDNVINFDRSSNPTPYQTINNHKTSSQSSDNKNLDNSPSVASSTSAPSVVSSTSAPSVVSSMIIDKHQKELFKLIHPKLLSIWLNSSINLITNIDLSSQTGAQVSLQKLIKNIANQKILQKKHLANQSSNTNSNSILNVSANPASTSNPGTGNNANALLSIGVNPSVTSQILQKQQDLDFEKMQTIIKRETDIKALNTRQLIEHLFETFSLNLSKVQQKATSTSSQNTCITAPYVLSDKVQLTSGLNKFNSTNSQTQTDRQWQQILNTVILKAFEQTYLKIKDVLNIDLFDFELPSVSASHLKTKNYHQIFNKNNQPNNLSNTQSNNFTFNVEGIKTVCCSAERLPNMFSPDFKGKALTLNESKPRHTILELVFNQIDTHQILANIVSQVQNENFSTDGATGFAHTINNVQISNEQCLFLLNFCKELCLINLLTQKPKTLCQWIDVFNGAPSSLFHENISIKNALLFNSLNLDVFSVFHNLAKPTSEVDNIKPTEQLIQSVRIDGKLSVGGDSNHSITSHCAAPKDAVKTSITKSTIETQPNSLESGRSPLYSWEQLLDEAFYFDSKEQKNNAIKTSDKPFFPTLYCSAIEAQSLELLRDYNSKFVALQNNLKLYVDTKKIEKSNESKENIYELFVFKTLQDNLSKLLTKTITSPNICLNSTIHGEEADCNFFNAIYELPQDHHLHHWWKEFCHFAKITDNLPQHTIHKILKIKTALPMQNTSPEASMTTQLNKTINSPEFSSEIKKNLYQKFSFQNTLISYPSALTLYSFLNPKEKNNPEFSTADILQITKKSNFIDQAHVILFNQIEALILKETFDKLDSSTSKPPPKSSKNRIGL